MRVLIVEDNADDAELMLLELRRGRLEVVHERIDTESAMNAALDARTWDIIISDFSLPQFSGLAALALVQRRGLDVPFILVSGNVGEETAVAAMKAGASDYVMKGNLARLVPAVQRELRDAEVRREARQTELNLYEREAQLAEAQRLAHVGSWHLNPRTNGATWSEEVYRICGRDPQEFRPTLEQFMEFVHPDDRALVMAPLRSPDAGRFAYDFRIVRADGTRFVYARGEIKRNEQGAPVEVVGTLQDITDRKLAEQTLRQANDELEAAVKERTTELSEANAHLIRQIAERKSAQSELEAARRAAEAANHSKSAFLANMSHEIRTPMTAILGYADMLMAPGQSPSERLDCIQTIRRQSEHLLSILNDILDLSKIEAGRLDVERIACDPSRIVSEAVSLMRVRAVEKNLQLSATFAEPIPATIKTDPTRLRQILINLIGNAIKFTECGGVKVIVSLHNGSQSSSPLLRMDVIDSGIGMSAHESAALFQPFTQADTSTTRRFGGTGLGLSICKRLAQMLGGDITLQSSPRSGSCFTVTIETGNLGGVPLVSKTHEAVNDSAFAPNASVDSGGRSVQLRGSILLAEDGIHNQRVISYYVQKAGATVELAENGRIACEKAMAALAAKTPFDLILMDMQMPELDGYSAAAVLRSKGYAGPIVALTAHAMSGDRAKCINAGCTDYLTKPIEKRLLLEIAAKYLVGSNVPPADSQIQAPSVPVQLDTATDPVIAQFLPAFVADLPAQVNRILAMVNQQDVDNLRKVLHQLKGTGGLYGFPEMTDLAESAEKHLIDTPIIDVAANDVKALVELIRGVKGYEGNKEALSPEVSAHGTNPNR